MEPIETLTQALDAITQGVDSRDHEPDPGRADWARQRAAVAALRARYEDDVVPNVELLARALPADKQQNVRNNVAFMGGELSALLRASGDEPGAVRVLRSAQKIGPAGSILEELDGASKDPAGHVALCRARWHQRHGDWDEGDRILRAAKKTATDPAIKKGLDLVLHGSRPLTGAPALFRINGFGASVYGERDRRDDGSYVTTYCISALFVPVFPLSAYRVKEQGYGSYVFMSKEQLSPFAKGYRWALLGAIVLGVAFTGISGYLGRPDRLAAIALEDVRAVEARGDLEATLAAYESLFSSHGYALSAHDRSEAAQAYVRHLASTVPSPVVPERLPDVERAVGRFEALPESVRAGQGEGAMLERVGAWADELGTADEAHVRAALHVVERGHALRRPYDTGDLPLFGASPGGGSAWSGDAARSDDPARAALGARASELHRALGGFLAADWPLDALAEYVASGPDAAAVAAAAPLVQEIAASPSLALAARPSLEAWSLAAGRGAPDHETVRARVTEAIAAGVAMEGDAARADALATGDEAGLRAAVARVPGDQACIAALADLSRARGDSAAAIAALRAIGAPGRMVPAALRSLAAAELDAGHVDEARGMLARVVEPRLAELHAAQEALDSAERTRSEGLIRQLEIGLGPPAIQSRLRTATDEQAREIVFEYMREQLDSDPTISAARARYEAVAPIVPAILQLAMIELRRAGALSGAERDVALASAERLFLAIQAEGASVPEYHLGLGQVYYRLGRTAEGESELEGVLASGDDRLALLVAHAYRELGLVDRARQTAETVHSRGVQPHAGNAAVFLSVIAERLEDVETWLSRAPDQSAPEVAVRLLEVRAQRALRDRRFAEADRGFADVARRYEAMGASDAVSVNNAAVAWQQRYLATGNPAHLDEAVERFERAVRLAPEQSLTITNLAEAHAFRGSLRVISRWVDLPSVRLESDQTSSVLGMLLAGPMHDEVVAAMREDASLRRSQELTRQEQVLAPRRAGAWQRELGMLARLGDVEALRSLEERVAQVGAIEESASRRQAWERGEYDRDLVEHAGQDLARADDLLVAARRARNARAIAVLSALRGGALLERHVASALDAASDADVEAAVASYREAVASWPELGAQSSLGHALLVRALVHDPEARALLETERRRYGPIFVARHAAARAETANRLRASADVREALALAAALEPARMRLEELALAEALGDESLRGRTAHVRDREELRLELAIDQRLDPSDPEAPERIALLSP